jgi:hypothetical protein
VIETEHTAQGAYKFYAPWTHAVTERTAVPGSMKNRLSDSYQLSDPESHGGETQFEHPGTLPVGSHRSGWLSATVVPVRLTAPHKS